MSYQERITADMKAAMKAGEKDKLTVLRMLIAAFKAAADEKGGDLDEAAELAILSKAVKTRRDAADQGKAAGRQDVVDREEAEIVLIQGYLPAQLEGEELAAKVAEVAAEVGYGGPKDKGAFMKAWMGRYKGRADGRAVQEALGALGGG